MANPFKIASDKAKQSGDNYTAKRIEAEGAIAEALVKYLINEGFTVSVNDGEEYVIERSTDLNAILSVMFTTDEESICAYHGTAETAWFYLTYGNDGFDVVADYTIGVGDDVWVMAIKPLADKYERELNDI